MYITNKNDHYFVIDCDIDRTKLKDCKFFNSFEKMKEYLISEVHESHIDEDEINEDSCIIIRDKRYEYLWFGLTNYETTKEDFINNFEL